MDFKVLFVITFLLSTFVDVLHRGHRQVEYSPCTTAATSHVCHQPRAELHFAGHRMHTRFEVQTFPSTLDAIPSYSCAGKTSRHQQEVDQVVDRALQVARERPRQGHMKLGQDQQPRLNQGNVDFPHNETLQHRCYTTQELYSTPMEILSVRRIFDNRSIKAGNSPNHQGFSGYIYSP